MTNRGERLTGKDIALSIQHLFAMFGATILVPLITGLNPSTALLTAGIGTLLFHLVTKGKVPVFLGSSFAFLGACSLYVPEMIDGVSKNVIHPERLPYVQGGIIFAGAMYLIFSLIAFLVGPDNMKKVFPPVVTGPVIVVIGIQLSSTAIQDCCSINDQIPINMGLSFGIALFTLAIVIICTIFSKGFFKLVPILIGLFFGWILCLILTLAGVLPEQYMNFAAIESANWFNFIGSVDSNGVPFLSLPKFDIGFILSIAPIALVTFMEHIGDITTNSAVVGKNFLKDPGLHRTLLGDGIATFFAGLIGGPANTTYSENTGVLATTKNYNPRLLRITAIFAIFLALFGKFGSILQTIPRPVKGGVEVMLFGMIAAIGIRTLAESKLDFTNSRNLIVVGSILVFGLGIGAIGGFTFVINSDVTLTISGLFVAVVVGVLLNIILPIQDDKTSSEK